MLCKKLLTASLAVCISLIMACSAWAEPTEGSEAEVTLVEAAPTTASGTGGSGDSSNQADSSSGGSEDSSSSGSGAESSSSGGLESSSSGESESSSSDSSSSSSSQSSSSGMTKLDQLRNAGPGVAQSAGSGTPGALTYVDADTILYGGVTYKKGDYQGTHKMSGYTWSDEYGNMTASGKGATANHTVAYSSSLPLGTQIIVEYVNGPLDHRYDGVYTVEDRGDYHIESEGWVDIFFDTYAQAIGITSNGWNYANVWVAIPQ